MKKLSRSFLYSLTIVSVLLMSTLGTTSVFADGGTSDDPAPEEPATTPPDNTTVEEPPTVQAPESQAPPEEPATTPPDNTTEDEPSTDQAPESQPSPEEPPADSPETTPITEPAEEEPISVPEILEQIPGETNLVVLNEDGTAEPLATQKAAEILKEADPMWCPAGQDPIPLSNGCTTNHLTFNSLIGDLSGGAYSGNGVIWVDSTYQGQDTGPITFDGTNGNLANLQDITVHGGWDGTSSGGDVPNTPSMADDRMTFINWLGNITIKNFKLENALSINSDLIINASLIIETDGDISLDNVTVTGNTATEGHGVRLDNCLPGGTEICTVSGDQSITNSSFSSNDNDGMNTQSSGNVNMSNVSAADNGDDGIRLDTDSGNGNNLNFTDLQFINNGDDGLEIDDVDGNISLTKITSTGNANDGIEIDDTVGNVTVTNSTASGNGTDGVDINNTNGTVKLDTVTTSNNTDNGVEIINNNNGNVELKCVTALNNGADGAYIRTLGNVAVKCSQFKDNIEDGLQIDNAPTAQLLSVSAARNGDQDIKINHNVTYVTKKEIDCSGKKTCQSCKSTSTQDYYTTLVCPPTDTTASLFDTSGDEVSFDHLCGYDAGIFDQTSRYIPKTIPGADDYISDLYSRLLEYLKAIQEGDEEAAGKYAMILYDLAYVLPEDYEYQAGLLAVVLENGIYLDPLPEGAEVTVKFQMPEGLDADEELTILWWNGMDWSDIGGTVSVDGLFFQTTTDKIGVFVLAVHEND